MSLNLANLFYFWSHLLIDRKCKVWWELSTWPNVIQWIASYSQPSSFFWTTYFIHWLAVHWIRSCPVDNLFQWITLSSILNKWALVISAPKIVIPAPSSIGTFFSQFGTYILHVSLVFFFPSFVHLKIIILLIF